MPKEKPFLTAEWRHILFLNYEVDPAVLTPWIPAGTELDLWEGKALVSMVGFLFLKTRVLGIPIPFHVNFEEVNLRFYVHRRAENEHRRGVVFIKEIVPRLWIARIARWVYGEHYMALRMQHTLELHSGTLPPDGLVEYGWRYKGRLNRLGGLVQGQPCPLEPGSHEAFIMDQAWGYTRLNRRKTGEYRVAHPVWQVRPVAQPYLLCNVKDLYGEKMEPFLRQRPYSAFMAEGSAVSVYPGERYKTKPEKDQKRAA